MTTHSSGSTRNPTVTFWGAAQSVTGSMHLVEVGDHKVLLDCGLARGPRSASPSRHRPFPFTPHEISAVVLSHAHIDHCGHLPDLVRQGFEGPIYCTAATRDLLEVMLTDSVRFQEEDALVLSVLGRSEDPDRPPPWTRQHSDQTVQQCVPLPYDHFQEINGDLGFRLADAGHILGSAMIALTVAGRGGERTLTFTGDLGRPGSPLLQPPAPVPAADVLICESTYGGRRHEPMPRVAEALEDVVRRTVERDGKVLVPAFSLGRVQSVAHTLQQAICRGRLPAVPVFVDSPLAADIAEVYRRHPAYLSADTARQLQADPDFLGGQTIHYVRSAEESKHLATRREPCVVIASSGMCDGGRIVQHLKHNVDDPRVAIVLVSYQAPQTPGRRLLERGPTVRFLGRRWNKWAEVVDLHGFSGHADQGELLTLLRPLAGRVGKVRLVHGELEQAEALAEALHGEGFADVAVPELGESVSWE
jgi:metallo-beta-lactamase family protein